jgi:hypothetical protein
MVCGNTSEGDGSPYDPEGRRTTLLKGRPNQARFWSFVYYPRECKKHSRALPSIDAFHVELEADGSYVVTARLPGFQAK